MLQVAARASSRELVIRCEHRAQRVQHVLPRLLSRAALAEGSGNLQHPRDNPALLIGLVEGNREVDRRQHSHRIASGYAGERGPRQLCLSSRDGDRVDRVQSSPPGLPSDRLHEILKESIPVPVPYPAPHLLWGTGGGGRARERIDPRRLAAFAAEPRGSFAGEGLAVKDSGPADAAGSDKAAGAGRCASQLNASPKPTADSPGTSSCCGSARRGLRRG